MVYPYSGIYLANIKGKKKSKTSYNIGNNFQGVFLREKKNKDNQQSVQHTYHLWIKSRGKLKYLSVTMCICIQCFFKDTHETVLQQKVNITHVQGRGTRLQEDMSLYLFIFLNLHEFIMNSKEYIVCESKHMKKLLLYHHICGKDKPHSRQW